MCTGSPDTRVLLLLKTINYDQKQISQLVHIEAAQVSKGRLVTFEPKYLLKNMKMLLKPLLGQSQG